MKHLVFVILAWFFLLLGIIGILLPVMPTTPFLLAALYFAVESPRVQKFINSNPILKKYVEWFQGKRPLSPKIKYASLAMVWISLSISFYFTDSAVTHIALLLVGIILSIYFLHLKIH